MLQINEIANGKQIQVQRGQQFEIRLPEIPTTGYRWSLVSNGTPACEALKDFYESPQVHGVDVQGTHYWQFQAAQAGSGTITLASQRPWEHGQNPARTFTLKVQVSE